MQTKPLETIIERFCTAAAQHAEATECSEYRRGNRAYKSIIDALKKLEAQQATELLRPLLQSSNLGVRVWAATPLLSQNDPDAERALQEVAEQKGIQALNAEMTLREWRAGRLQPLL